MALRRHRAALDALGGFYGGILSAVVLLDWGVNQIARWLTMRTEDATAAVAIAMDRLVDHYHGTTPRPTPVAIELPAVTPPPLPGFSPDRAGRWRTGGQVSAIGP